MEKPRKYVVVDLETTGLYANRNSITEIGAIMVDPNKDERISFQRLIWREKPIDPEVVEKTGITVGLLKSKGIPLKDAMDEFLAFIGDTPIVAYNANFDSGFLRAAAMKCGLEINNEFICALELARQAWIGLPNYKLETVSRHLQLDMTDQHRSLSDCRRTVDVFEAGHAILEEREREKAAKAAMRSRRKPRPAQTKEEIAAPPEPIFIRETPPQKEDEELEQSVLEVFGESIDDYFSAQIGGATCANEDGVMRSRLISECEKMEILELEHEPDNPFDAHAVKVIRHKTGGMLGYLPAKAAADILRRIDAGTHWLAAFGDLIENPETGLCGGATIVVMRWNDEMQAAREERLRPKTMEERWALVRQQRAERLKHFNRAEKQ